MSSTKTHTLSGCSLCLLLFIIALWLKILEMMSDELTVVCVAITFFNPFMNKQVARSRIYWLLVLLNDSHLFYSQCLWTDFIEMHTNKNAQSSELTFYVDYSFYIRMTKLTINLSKLRTFHWFEVHSEHR